MLLNGFPGEAGVCSRADPCIREPSHAPLDVRQPLGAGKPAGQRCRPHRFLEQPRHGGNSFNRLPPDRSYFQALSGYGATWVRLSYDKWKPQGRDFLLGDADAYKGLSPQDLAQLKTVLDNAHAAGLKVVIAPLSLPGMRWSQNNQGQFDDRLWRDKRYWTQAATFGMTLPKN